MYNAVYLEIRVWSDDNDSDARSIHCADCARVWDGVFRVLRLHYVSLAVYDFDARKAH